MASDAFRAIGNAMAGIPAMAEINLFYHSGIRCDIAETVAAAAAATAAETAAAAASSEF